MSPRLPSMSSHHRPSRPEAGPVARLLVRHLDQVEVFVRRALDPATRAKESVADLVQSVCREVLERERELSFSDEAAFRAYLHRAALRKVIDRRRYYTRAKRDAAREVHLQSEPGRGARAFGGVSEAQERFEAAFSRLATSHQEVFTLRRIFGHDTAETARRLGVSQGETRKRLASALARLAVLMGETAER